MEKQYPVVIGQPIDIRQMVALEYIIWKSPDLQNKEIAKKTIVWLLRKSEKLSKQISIVFTGREKHLNDILKGIHSIVSSNGNTHMNELLILLNSSMRFSSSNGLEKKPRASLSFDGNATRIFHDCIKEEIELIEPHSTSILT